MPYFPHFTLINPYFPFTQRSPRNLSDLSGKTRRYVVKNFSILKEPSAAPAIAELSAE